MTKTIKRSIAFLSAAVMVIAMLMYFLSGIINIDWGLTASAESDVSFTAVAGDPEGYTNEEYTNLFDGDTGTKWCCSFSDSAYVVIKASEPIYVSGYTISTANDSADNDGERNPVAWTLSACNDYTAESATWTPIDTITSGGLPVENETPKYFTFTETEETYQYFKLEITQIVSGSIMQISEFALEFSTCDHDWVKTSDTIPPTCTEGGYDVYECSKCHSTKNVANDDVPANGHTWVNGDVFAPTCTEHGYTLQTCSVCGAKQEADIKDALGHKFVDGACIRCKVADTTPIEPSKDTNGVYQIGTAGELYWFADYVNSVNNSASAVLTADITVNSNLLSSLEFDKDGNVTNGNNFTSWTPIGNDSTSYAGTFDGKGFTVSGLYFNDTDTDYVGLFGSSRGTIKNVGVVDSYFKGDDNVGGVCGQNDNKIENCYNTGSVSGSYYVGGVCGQNMGTIEKCYNTGSVSGSEAYVGGVCGDNSATIKNCYNTGSVSGENYVGGVCGYQTKGTIGNCYNIGSVSASFYISASKCEGGVCGKVYSGTIENCYYLSGTAAQGIGSGSGSAESKTTAQFASGEVCYLLNNGVTDGTQVWYQNIDNVETPDEYPKFVGGTVNQTETGYENLTGSAVSVDISWGTMSFTYNEAEKTWNPETHEYEVTKDAGWVCDEGENAVTVTNNSSSEITAQFTYTQTDTAVTGTFDKPSADIAAGDSASSYLTLSGEPAGKTEKSTLGTISVTIGG